MIPNVSNFLNIYTYINKTNINTSKNLILEPFLLIKLILLSYKDKSKISIYNNSIQYQEHPIYKSFTNMDLVIVEKIYIIFIIQ